MRRAVRVTGLLMIAGGALLLLWALVVWRWEDPLTAVYTWRQQSRLSNEYDKRLAGWRP